MGQYISVPMLGRTKVATPDPECIPVSDNSASNDSEDGPYITAKMELDDNGCLATSSYSISRTLADAVARLGTLSHEQITPMDYYNKYYNVSAVEFIAKNAPEYIVYQVGWDDTIECFYM